MCSTYAARGHPGRGLGPDRRSCPQLAHEIPEAIDPVVVGAEQVHEPAHGLVHVGGAGPDVARANYLAFERDFVGPVNIGTGVETDINRLYALLAQAAGSSAQAQHAPGKPGEQQRSCIDPSLAARVLGWQPSVALGEGLRLTLEHFRQRSRQEPGRAHG